MKCQAMAGFLIPRPCRNEATGQCPICGVEICSLHTVSFPGGGVSCPSCAKANQPQQESTPYDQYGYNTGSWGWGHHHGYNQRDYDAFDRTGEHSGERASGGPMESLDGS